MEGSPSVITAAELSTVLARLGDVSSMLGSGKST
jgi:hypothetical protein